MVPPVVLLHLLFGFPPTGTDSVNLTILPFFFMGDTVFHMTNFSILEVVWNYVTCGGLFLPLVLGGGSELIGGIPLVTFPRNYPPSAFRDIGRKVRL